MLYTFKDPVRHKFTKKSYNKREWTKYDEGLKNRGNLTIRFSEDAVASWNHVKPDTMKRGGQRVYSDLEGLCMKVGFEVRGLGGVF